MSAGSRAHNTVSCLKARWPASAVPQAPAPRTATFIAGTPCGALMLDAALRRAVRLGGTHLRETLLVERLEIDLGEVNRREAGAGDRVRDVRTQVREQYRRAGDAD